MTPILWIFARWPEPGKVKTRLCPPLSHLQAAELARAFLDDRVESLLALSEIDWGIAITPDDAELFKQAYPNIRLTPQGDGSLGARMARVVRQSLEKGHAAAMILGSDVPILPLEMIHSSSRRLLGGEVDLVLTPAPDGGYSMIGMNRPLEPLFEEMPWSTSEVLAETLRRADDLKLRVHLTVAAPDCDTTDDLLGLLRRYHSNPADFKKLLPGTAGWLDTHRDLLLKWRPIF